MTLNQEAQSHALPRSGSRLSAEPLLGIQVVNR